MNPESSYLKLTRIERIFVDSRLAGMTQIASAAAAGAGNPQKDGHRIADRQHVKDALVERMQAVAEEVDFSRKEAHEMYMEAYQNAETAMEQVAAVNAMVKLHGLEKPKVLEVAHTHQHKGEITLLPTDELMKLAGMEDALALDGEYEEVGEVPVLEPPKVTEDNLGHPEALQPVRDDY